MRKGSGNCYWLVRHGESTANREKLVVSLPENGVPAYGLTKKGAVQATATGKEFATEILTQSSKASVKPKVVIYYSDFLRAKETALYFERSLKQHCAESERELFVEGHETALLRERDFGQLELTPNVNYPFVWSADARNGKHSTAFDSESTHSVETRIRRLLSWTEAKHNDCHVVFVSHGDTCQIGQALFAGMEPHRQRELPHLHNAELRKLPSIPLEVADSLQLTADMALAPELHSAKHSFEVKEENEEVKEEMTDRSVDKHLTQNRTSIFAERLFATRAFRLSAGGVAFGLGAALPLWLRICTQRKVTVAWPSFTALCFATPLVAVLSTVVIDCFQTKGIRAEDSVKVCGLWNVLVFAVSFYGTYKFNTSVVSQ